MRRCHAAVTSGDCQREAQNRAGASASATAIESAASRARSAKPVRRAEGSADHVDGGPRMAQRLDPRLSAAHPGGRRADRRRLSRRGQHAAGSPGSGGVVRRPVGKDMVSRAWRKAKSDWEAWNERALDEEPIVRLILDGTAARVGSTAGRPRSRCWSCSACGRTARRSCWRSRTWAGRARRLGAAARRSRPARTANAGLVIVDGGPGLEKALAALWRDCRSSAAPCTSTAIFSPMRPTGCMRKFRTTTPT